MSPAGHDSEPDSDYDDPEATYDENDVYDQPSLPVITTRVSQDVYDEPPKEESDSFDSEDEKPKARKQLLSAPGKESLPPNKPPPPLTKKPIVPRDKKVIG